MDDYQQRVINERNELEEKICKLTNFLFSDKSRGLIKGETQRMHNQLHAMRNYHITLTDRVNNFCREIDVENVVEEEQKRWQDAIYKLLLAQVKDDSIDGAGCDSGDPLDFTLTEIDQALGILEARIPVWSAVGDVRPPHGIPLWGWSPEWVEGDFNPEGIRECFWNDDGIWTSCGWDPCQDVYTTDSTNTPVKWAYRSGPSQ